MHSSPLPLLQSRLFLVVIISIFFISNTYAGNDSIESMSRGFEALSIQQPAKAHTHPDRGNDSSVQITTFSGTKTGGMDKALSSAEDSAGKRSSDRKGSRSRASRDSQNSSGSGSSDGDREKSSPTHSIEDQTEAWMTCTLDARSLALAGLHLPDLNDDRVLIGLISPAKFHDLKKKTNNLLHKKLLVLEQFHNNMLQTMQIAAENADRSPTPIQWHHLYSRILKTQSSTNQPTSISRARSKRSSSSITLTPEYQLKESFKKIYALKLTDFDQFESWQQFKTQLKEREWMKQALVQNFDKLQWALSPVDHWNNTGEGLAVLWLSPQASTGLPKHQECLINALSPSLMGEELLQLMAIVSTDNAKHFVTNMNSDFKPSKHQLSSFSPTVQPTKTEQEATSRLKTSTHFYSELENQQPIRNEETTASIASSGAHKPLSTPKKNSSDSSKLPTKKLTPSQLAVISANTPLLKTYFHTLWPERVHTLVSTTNKPRQVEDKDVLEALLAWDKSHQPKASLHNLETMFLESISTLDDQEEIATLIGNQLQIAYDIAIHPSPTQLFPQQLTSNDIEQILKRINWYGYKKHLLLMFNFPITVDFATALRHKKHLTWDNLIDKTERINEWLSNAITILAYDSVSRSIAAKGDDSARSTPLPKILFKSLSMSKKLHQLGFHCPDDPIPEAAHLFKILTVAGFEELDWNTLVTTFAKDCDEISRSDSPDLNDTSGLAMQYREPFKYWIEQAEKNTQQLCWHHFFQKMFEIDLRFSLSVLKQWHMTDGNRTVKTY